MKKGKKQKRKIAFKVVIAFVLLALVIIIVAAVIKTRNDLSVANVINAIGTMWEKSETTDEFEYERSESAMPLDGGFVTVSNGGIRTYNSAGKENLVSSFTMQNPTLAVSGAYAAAYDIGGYIVKIFDTDNIVREIETENPIISADLNEKGWLALCTQETGYSSSATVYNESGTAVYKWSSGEGYVFSAKVYDNNSKMALLVLDADGTSFVRLALNSEEETGRFSLPGRVIVDFGFVGNGISLITDLGIVFLNKDGEKNAEYDFGGRSLCSYTMENGRSVMAVLTEDAMQTSGEIVIIMPDGTEKGKISVSEKVTDVSSNKKRYAVLGESGAVIYNEKFEKLSVYDDAEGERIVFLDDGVMAVGEYMARLFK